MKSHPTKLLGGFLYMALYKMIFTMRLQLRLRRAARKLIYAKGKVLAHISGPSGSGKTRLSEDLAKLYPDITFKDLDEFDDAAVAQLGWTDIRKQEYSDAMLAKLAKLRQKLMDHFIEANSNPIVFVGIHNEGPHILSIPTVNRIRLDTDARTSAWRAYQRSLNEELRYRRTVEELPLDEKEAQEVINFLDQHGYRTMSREEIIDWVVLHQQ